MNYQEAYRYLYQTLPMYQRIGKAAYKEGMGNAYLLDEYFQHPHKDFRTIHVAGTNGKGSVSHMIASVLQECGYKVGLYTSPHLLDYRERIKVNGEWIDKNFIVDFIKWHQEKFETIQPSFFEISVFMALEYFRTRQVDFAVIEVGLGGRLDTTNVILPEVSVITNIGFDHMEFLGNTLEKIAGEKAGIIKEHIPVVIGEYQEECARIFIHAAENKKAPWLFADEFYTCKFSTKTLHNTMKHHITSVKDETKSIEIETDLLGFYQQKNIITSLCVLNELKTIAKRVKKIHILEGLKHVTQTTGLMGRWQMISSRPLTICDVAHNEQGILQVIEQIRNTPYKQLHLILGFVQDKDVRKLLNLFPDEAIYYYTQSGVPRSMNHKDLKNLADSIEKPGSSYKSVRNAYVEARQKADAHDLIFIGGSSFVVADFLSSQM